MATQPDFWGDIEVEQVRTPVAILREQAALLGAKTKNMIEAKVNTHAFKGVFSHQFDVVVPALDNYTYQMFTIRHGVRMYPVTVAGSGRQLTSEPEFLDWLQKELSSPETKQIIGNILAQIVN